MGCSASRSADRIKEETILTAVVLKDAASSGIEAAWEKVRELWMKEVTLDEKILREAADLKDLKKAVREVAEAYRTWSEVTTDTLILPGLSVWSRDAWFVGGAVAAEALHRHACLQAELTRLTMKLRMVVRRHFVGALEAATHCLESALAVVRDYEDAAYRAHHAREKLGQTRTFALPQFRTPFTEDSGPDLTAAGLRAAALAERELEEARQKATEEASTLVALEEKAEALKEVARKKLRETRKEVETKHVALAFVALHGGYERLSRDTRSLTDWSPDFEKALIQYRPYEAHTTVCNGFAGVRASSGDLLEGMLQQAEDDFMLHAAVDETDEDVLQQSAALAGFEHRLRESRAMLVITLWQTQTYLHGGLRLLHGPVQGCALLRLLASQLSDTPVAELVRAARCVDLPEHAGELRLEGLKLCRQMDLFVQKEIVAQLAAIRRHRSLVTQSRVQEAKKLESTLLETRDALAAEAEGSVLRLVAVPFGTLVEKLRDFTQAKQGPSALEAAARVSLQGSPALDGVFECDATPWHAVFSLGQTGLATPTVVKKKEEPILVGEEWADI
jgi:hypothetical protein